MNNLKSKTQNRMALEVLLISLAFILAFSAVAWRLEEAPDVFTDEILYTRAGIRVAGEGALVWDNGEPLFVHPPLYFLAAGAYLWLTSDPAGALQGPGDIFSWVYRARYLNALLAGLTGVTLYLAGRRLRGIGLGIVLVALFFLDPFGVRINRRAMLETMGALFSLAGMTLLLFEWGHFRPLRAIPAGLLLGAGMLTKELTFTAPLAVFLYGGWELWRSRKTGERESLSLHSPPAMHAFLAVITAGLTYGLFPAWALTTGRWDRFMAVKSLSLQRLLGLTQLSGWNRAELSIVDFLAQRLNDYGSSYLLLGLGGLATLFLLLEWRRKAKQGFLPPGGRLLAVWGLVLYPFYAFVALIGPGNDQFFYFLLLPAILLVGYAATILPKVASLRLSIASAIPGMTGSPLSNSPSVGNGVKLRNSARQALPLSPSQREGERKASPPLGGIEGGLSAKRVFIVALLLAPILTFNALRWWLVFGAGPDNAYYQLAAYVEEHLPAGTAINASGDAIKFEYFLPNHLVTSAATPEEAQAAGVRYFALSPKDVWARYGSITPELAAWIEAEGELRLALSGESYGELFFYRVDYADNLPALAAENNVLPGDGSPPEQALPPSYTRSFPPAKAGFVDNLPFFLGLWLVTCGGLAIWLDRRLLRSPLRPAATAAGLEAL